MTVYDLNRDQLAELKARYYADRTGEDLSYDEIVNIDNLVSDAEIYRYYQAFSFVPEDFASSSDEEYEDAEYSLDADLSGTREYIVEQLRLIADDIEGGNYGGLAGGYGASWGLNRI